jgi:hypothetical protein
MTAIQNKNNNKTFLSSNIFPFSWHHFSTVIPFFHYRSKLGIHRHRCIPNLNHIYIHQIAGAHPAVPRTDDRRLVEKFLSIFSQQERKRKRDALPQTSFEDLFLIMTAIPSLIVWIRRCQIETFISCRRTSFRLVHTIFLLYRIIFPFSFTLIYMYPCIKEKHSSFVLKHPSNWLNHFSLDILFSLISKSTACSFYDDASSSVWRRRATQHIT